MSPLTKTFFVLFILGFLFGPLGDSFHVNSGMEVYSPETNVFLIPYLNVPFWVAWEFGFATIGIGTAHLLMRKQGKVHTDLLGAPRVIVGLLSTLILWAFSAYAPFETGGAKDLILGTAALLTWHLLDRTAIGIATSLGTALIGASCEIALIRLGVFRYAEPTNNFLSSIPTWLPWLYFSASVSVGALTERLRQQRPPDTKN